MAGQCAISVSAVTEAVASITLAVTTPINPHIYGVNFPTDAGYITRLGVTASRWGGNAVTAYALPALTTSLTAPDTTRTVTSRTRATTGTSRTVPVIMETRMTGWDGLKVQALPHSLLFLRKCL